MRVSDWLFLDELSASPLPPSLVDDQRRAAQLAAHQQPKALDADPHRPRRGAAGSRLSSDRPDAI